jgi:hypothetical protein
MNDNINIDSTIAVSMNDNINMDSTIAVSMNDNINMDSKIVRHRLTLFCLFYELRRLITHFESTKFVFLQPANLKWNIKF